MEMFNSTIGSAKQRGKQNNGSKTKKYENISMVSFVASNRLQVKEPKVIVQSTS